MEEKELQHISLLHDIRMYVVEQMDQTDGHIERYELSIRATQKYPDVEEEDISYCVLAGIDDWFQMRDEEDMEENDWA